MTLLKDTRALEQGIVGKDPKYIHFYLVFVSKGIDRLEVLNPDCECNLLGKC